MNHSPGATTRGEEARSRSRIPARASAPGRGGPQDCRRMPGQRERRHWERDEAAAPRIIEEFEQFDDQQITEQGETRAGPLAALPGRPSPAEVVGDFRRPPGDVEGPDGGDGRGRPILGCPPIRCLHLASRGLLMRKARGDNLGPTSGGGSIWPGGPVWRRVPARSDPSRRIRARRDPRHQPADRDADLPHHRGQRVTGGVMSLGNVSLGHSDGIHR